MTSSARARSKLVDALIVGALVLACARFVSAGLLGGSGQIHLDPSWFGEQLGPLHEIRQGTAVTRIDERQYGVVALLPIDLALRLGVDLQAAEIVALAIGLISATIAFALLAERSGLRGRALLLHAIGWLMFVPLLHALGGRQVDVWVLALVSVAAVLYASAVPLALSFSAVALALATFVKLLPGALLVLVALRARAAAAAALVSVLSILALGQVLYGPPLGFGYPLEILLRLPESTSQWSTHHENNSLRGLAFKVAAGFEIALGPDGRSSGYVVEPQVAPLVHALVLGAGVLIAGHAVRAVVRGRNADSRERRWIEFGLGVAAMLLIAPHTSHEFMVVTLVPFMIVSWLLRRSRPGAWSRPQIGVAVASVLLVGVFVPLRLLEPVLQLAIRLSANEAHYGPNIGAYDFFGLPGIGLILLWTTFVALEARTLGAPAPAHGSLSAAK